MAVADVPRAMREYVERFCKTTRWFHWSFALPFLGLAATGGTLALREELGLAPEVAARLVSWHEGIAVAWLLLPPIVLLSGRTRETLRDLTSAWRFDRSDLRWLLLQPAAMFGRAELPAAGKLNGGQKVNAMLTCLFAAGLMASGTWLWLAPAALAPWLLHLALFAGWLPAFCGHVYLAVLNPGTRHALRGMVLGTSEIEWARHHHPVWVESLDRDRVTRSGATPSPRTTGAAPGTRTRFADEQV